MGDSYKLRHADKKYGGGGYGMIGIYIIQNELNGKVYIGQSKDVMGRIDDHIRTLNDGTHYNIHLQGAWREYGESNFCFDLLEECYVEELNDNEIWWIMYYDSNNPQTGYNLTSGGEGVPVTEEVRQRMCQIQKEICNRPDIRESRRKQQLITQNLPEVKERNRQAHLGKVHSSTTRDKISNATRDGMNNPDVRARCTEVNRINGAKRREQTKLKNEQKALENKSFFDAWREGRMSNATT